MAAYDKAVDSKALEAGLTTVANAIRAKGGTSEPLNGPEEMAAAVEAITGGGGDTLEFSWFNGDAPMSIRSLDLPKMVNTLILDQRGATSGPPILRGLRFGGPGNVIIKGAPKKYQRTADTLRQCTNIVRIDFVPSIAPITMERWIYQFYSPSCTVTGINLDNMGKGGLNFAIAAGVAVDVVWEGYLHTSQNLGGEKSIYMSLTEESTHLFMEHLADVSKGEPQTLTLSKYMQRYITSEEIKAANAKGWTIV